MENFLKIYWILELKIIINGNKNIYYNKIKPDKLNRLDNKHGNSFVELYLNNYYFISSYVIKSANDFDDRDPESWILFGLNENEEWIKLDKRNNQ